MDTVVLQGRFVVPLGLKLFLCIWAVIGIGLFAAAASADASTGPLLAMFGAVLTGSSLFGWWQATANRKRFRATVYQDRVEAVFAGRRTVHRLEASKIESVIFQDSALGRAAYGAVVVQGSGSGKIRIVNLAEHEKFADAVRSISSASIRKDASNVPPAESTDLPSQIAKLEALRSTGVLSEDEFVAAKTRLLS